MIRELERQIREKEAYLAERRETQAEARKTANRYRQAHQEAMDVLNHRAAELALEEYADAQALVTELQADIDRLVSDIDGLQRLIADTQAVRAVAA